MAIDPYHVAPPPNQRRRINMNDSKSIYHHENKSKQQYKHKKPNRFHDVINVQIQLPLTLKYNNLKQQQICNTNNKEKTIKFKQLPKIGAFLRTDPDKMDIVRAIDAEFDEKSIKKLREISSINKSSKWMLCSITYNIHSALYQLLSILTDNQITNTIQSDINKYNKILIAFNPELSIYNASDDDKRNLLTSTILQFTNISTSKIMHHHNDNKYNKHKDVQQIQPFKHHKLLNLKDINNMNINSMTKTLFEWIKQQSISPNIEIEAKIGKLIINNTSFIRIHKKLGITTPSIIRKCEEKFIPGIDDGIFKYLISNIFNKWWKHYNLHNMNDEYFKIGKCAETKTMDEMYYGSNMRSTYNLNTRNINNIFPPKTIEKKKINKYSTVNISCPGLDFDFRISASFEHKVNKSENKKIKMVRFKHRRYYFYDYFSIQITEVYQYDKNLTHDFITKCKVKFANKHNVLNEISMPMDQHNGARRVFEVELEIDKKYLFQSVQLTKQQNNNNNNMKPLKDLVYHFVQSSMKLTTLVSKKYNDSAVFPVLK